MRKTDNLLAIDIGNSSNSYGLFKSGRLIRFWHGNDDIIPKIEQYIRRSGVLSNNYKVIISSVSPIRFKRVRNRLSGSACRIGTEIKVKINHKYININKLGKDRLVNLYGAGQFYKGPTLVLSFGTAITADILTKHHEFQGGLIIPGLETSLRGLEARAALLPKNVVLKGSRQDLIGRNTRDCMLLGVLQGFGAMVDGLIERFRKKYGRNLKVIACGGHAALIKPYVKSQMKVDQTHTVKSLALLFKKGNDHDEQS